MKKCFTGAINFSIFLFLLCPVVLQAETVRIGMITDLTGRAAYWGEQSSLGARLAVDDLKKRGIDVEVVFEDTLLDTKKAVSAAHKLMYVDKVDVLYSEFTPVSTAISPVVKNQKRILLYSAAASSLVDSNPYAFKTYLDYVEGCKRIAEFWKSKGLKKIAVLRATAEFGELCTTGARMVYPDLFDIAYKFGDEVSTQVLLLKNKGAEGVLNATYEADFINMLKAMEAIQYKPFVAGNSDAVTHTTAKQFPKFGAQMMRFGFAPIAPDFLKKVKLKDPENDMGSIEAAALSYTHIQQIVTAVRACPEKKTDCLLEQLSKSPADSTIEFKGWRGRQAAFDIRISSWRDGKAVALQ